jgi:hypothetical protein
MDAALLFGFGDGIQQDRMREERAFADVFVDAGEFLPDDAAGTDIEVTNFRVA